MKSIGRLLIVVTIVVAANLIFWPKKTALVDHSEKPTGRHTQRNTFERNLNQYKPQLVLMGNSMLTEGVDQRGFMSYTQKRTLFFARGGSASAWWYLGLKNIIAESNTKPKLLAVFFRDDFLTKPKFRTTDTYKLAINDLANISEPLLDRLAYLNGMDYPTYMLSKLSPLFQQKDNIRKDVESFIKGTCVSYLVSADTVKIDNAMANVFHKKNMNQKLMTAKQLTAESTASKGKANFQTKLKKSFLPQMIDIAKENDIQLVFLRIKRRRDVNPNAQSEYLKNYVVDLQEYLTSHNIDLIDFTDDSRLKLEHYADGDHLDRKKGRPIFTKIVANSLMPYIRTHCK